MRKEIRKPKNPETVKLPDNLISFLSDVHQLIREKDKLATTESGDLLQCDYAYGGLEDSRTGIYNFSYFPDAEGTRNTWQFALTESEIEKVTKGEIKELNLWSCKDSSCGCKFAVENDSCFYCDWVETSSRT